MECDICSREFGGRRQPLCVSCAQDALYAPRYQQVIGLLDREKSHTHAEAIVRPGNDGVLAALPDDTDFDSITGGIKRHSHERIHAEREAVDHRISQIVDKAEELRRQIEDYKDTLQGQKQDLERRRKELATERNELNKAKSRAFDPIEATTKKANQRMDKIHGRTADARHLLCRELASASSLHRRKNARGRSEYVLGGIVIPDLRELNLKTQAPPKSNIVGGRTLAEPHDLVSEALESVARLVTLSSHYLSVRLPSEIIIPHEDFPRTVIMPEKSSYKFKNVPFPAIAGAGISRNSSPAASRILEQNQPRPRHLWLDRPLAQLYKEDQKTYGLFVEGVTLLAWDLAYLCRTQGIDSINTFDDACAIGRNLWRLLMTQHRRPTERPQLDRKSTGLTDRSDTGMRLGMYSHSSARHNLAGWEGLDLMQDWKLASSARMMDKLKSYLVTEIAGAEWDLLEEKEWDEERDDEKPVLVGGSRLPQESRHPAMSVMSVAPHRDGTEDEKNSASENKKKGSSGWMKVRGRNSDA